MNHSETGAERPVSDPRHASLEEIRRSPLMDLIGLAQSIQRFLQTAQEPASDDYRNFLEFGVLTEIHQALARHGIEPFLTSPRGVNRHFQAVERVEETDNLHFDGRVQRVTRGYARGDQVIEKERVIMYRLRRTIESVRESL